MVRIVDLKVDSRTQDSVIISLVIEWEESVRDCGRDDNDDQRYLRAHIKGCKLKGITHPNGTFQVKKYPPMLREIFEHWPGALIQAVNEALNPQLVPIAPKTSALDLDFMGLFK